MKLKGRNKASNSQVKKDRNSFLPWGKVKAFRTQVKDFCLAIPRSCSSKLQKINSHDDWGIVRLLSLGLITISTGIICNVATRWLKDGPDTLGFILVIIQSMGVLITAGGAFTLVGQEYNKRLLENFNLLKYWRSFNLFFSILLLVASLILWQSLPDISDYYSNQGFQQYKIGELSRAEESYKRSLNLNPENNQVNFRLGLLYDDLQNMEKARMSYQAAALAGIPEAVNNLSRMNLRAKDQRVSSSLLLKALEQSKLEPEIHYSLVKNLGWVRFQLGDYSGAEEKLNEAIHLQITNNLIEKSKKYSNTTSIPLASPYCLLAQVKTVQGDHSAALTDWENCNSLANPHIPEEDEWSITACKLLKAQDQGSKK